ncbi:MAG: M48 family metallopeptidase [Hyphomonadaceae bacterium]|nr:M48 family metallopeptidase [Hyphomonadaceae bacterium]
MRAIRALITSIATGIAAAVSLFALAGPALAQQQPSIIRDVEIEETLRIYARPGIVAAGLTPDEIQLVLIGDPSINAFVTNGQKIFVHTGLILRAKNPNEIIGVLAHETGHIAGGHLARNREAMSYAMRPAMISIGLGILAIAAGAPDAGAALIGGAPQFAQASFVRHTQVQESAADQAGAQYLEASGQTGKGLIEFFNREFRPNEFAVRRVPAYMVTHPFTSDRIEALRQRVEHSDHYGAVDTPDNIRRFQFMQAKLTGFIEPLARTLQIYPPSDNSQPARYARAIAYCGCGAQAKVPDLPRATAAINSLIAEDPSNPFFQELAGQILFENGRTAESIPYHRRSVELRPHEALLQINLARAILQARGRAGSDEAIALLQQAVQEEPDNAFGWRELASAHDLRGEEGLARLASAEMAYAVGDMGRALSFAERARRTLPQGTASWQRASDIVASVQNAMPDERGRQRSGG